MSYVAIYTPLKRRSSLALLVGAVPGAIPPLMGWTAVTGRVDAGGLALFALLFAWQLPHFLAISLYLREDYARGGLKVFSLVHGERATRRAIAVTSLLLPPIAVLPAALGLMGPVAATAVALAASLAFAALALTGLHPPGRGAGLGAPRLPGDAGPPRGGHGGAGGRRAVTFAELLPAWNASLNALSGVLLVARLPGHPRRRAGAPPALHDRGGGGVGRLPGLLPDAGGAHRHPPLPRRGGRSAGSTSPSCSRTPSLAAAVAPHGAPHRSSSGVKNRRAEHRRLARVTLPIWLYVSATGVLVYLLLYQVAPRLPA